MTLGHFYRAILTCIARYCYRKLFVRLCIRQSVCLTTQARITKSSSTDSARTRFQIRSYQEIQKGSPQVKALNESVVEKNRKFQPLSRRISKTVQDSIKVSQPNQRENRIWREIVIQGHSSCILGSLKSRLRTVYRYIIMPASFQKKCMADAVSGR